MSDNIETAGAETAPAKERPDYEIAREELRQLMDSHALRIQSEFIPWSRSRNAPGRYDPGPLSPNANHAEKANRARALKSGWRSLNWKVTLVRTTGAPHATIKPRPIYESEYSAGEAHCPAYKDKRLGNADSVDRQNAIDSECETGRVHQYAPSLGGGYASAKPILPDSVDVFASIVRDAQDAIDSGGFESWAENYGYSTDSRHAEKIFRECVDSGLKLIAGIGAETLRSAADMAGRL